MLKIDENLADLERELSIAAERQLPFAMALGLTETAKKAAEVERAELPRRLDQPTPFTERGIYMRGATRTRLEAEVGIKDVQAGYLKRQITGGVRLPKGRAIPIPVGQRRNKYGNMPRGTLRRLLARPDTFSGKVRGVGGIWQRKRGRLGKNKVKLLIAYESSARYQRRLPFSKAGERRADQVFPVEFARAMTRALATSR